MNGLVLGAWGAVQATCAGGAMALGGALRDGVSHAGRPAGRSARRCSIRPPATPPCTTSSWALLFATLIAHRTAGRAARAGSVHRRTARGRLYRHPSRLGLAELPG
jgi:BCD family chlorophyll transporter-like MFS transporter